MKFKKNSQQEKQIKNQTRGKTSHIIYRYISIVLPNGSTIKTLTTLRNRIKPWLS